MPPSPQSGTRGRGLLKIFGTSRCRHIHNLLLCYHTRRLRDNSMSRSHHPGHETKRLTMRLRTQPRLERVCGPADGDCMDVATARHREKR